MTHVLWYIITIIIIIITIITTTIIIIISTIIIIIIIIVIIIIIIIIIKKIAVRSSRLCFLVRNSASGFTLVSCTRRTHIWSSETMLSFLSFLEGELCQRRKQHGLSLSDKCLILCDYASQHSSRKFSASQHSSRKFTSMKETWCRQHNADTRSFLGSNFSFYVNLVQVN